MLCTLLNGNLISTFYKLNVHAGICNYCRFTYTVSLMCAILSSLIALTPMKIQEFFTPIIKLAKQLKNSAKKLSVKTVQEPLITVSALLLFKCMETPADCIKII